MVTLQEKNMMALVEAFGPCTSVYETTTPAELLEDYSESGMAFMEWLVVLFDVEAIQADRAGCYDAVELQAMRDRVCACVAAFDASGAVS